jgi:hypothetical protein
MIIAGSAARRQKGRVLEGIVQIIGELVLQIVAEVLVELGLHSIAEPFRQPPNPWLASVGYALFGAVAGGLRLLLPPDHMMPAGVARLANLALTPVLVDGAMMALGAWRAQRGEPVLRIDRFAYGYLFALGLALVRFFGAD